MKNVRQFNHWQAREELDKLLVQMMANTRELGARCKDVDNERDLLRSLYETANTVKEWCRLDGHISITVSFQPDLPGVDESGEDDDPPF